MAGKIYLLPTLLGETNPKLVIPDEVLEKTLLLRHFFVENIRTARRYLRKLDPSFPIDDSIFLELSKKTEPKEIEKLLQICLQGISVGVMSEAGVPGIADPGAELVKLAHTKGLQIVPFVGPSSILMAMMASGLNGQNFAFNGYLPVKPQERIKRLKQLEQRCLKEKQAQLFIETPYRNNALLDDIIKNCLAETKLCIAANISCADEFIKTKKIKQWKSINPNLHKIPTLFILG